MCQNKKKFFKTIREEVENTPARDATYDFVLTYLKYMELEHHYLSDVGLSSVEAHTLKHICQNPGLTISDIVNYWGRTKGTVSSQISKLEDKGLVTRQILSENRKKTHIFPTDKGLAVNSCHVRYDIEETIRLLEWWDNAFSYEESYDFFKKLHSYKLFLEKRIKEL